MIVSASHRQAHLFRLSPLGEKAAPAEARASSREPEERVELSHAPSGPSGSQLARQSSWSRRLLAGVGLGMMAFSVAGCIPQGPGGADAGAGKADQQQVVTATDYTQRMDQLRSQKDKTAFYQMAEAGYQKAMLERFAGAPPAVLEIAQKAVQAFDFKGDPAEQQKLMREALTAISQLSSQDTQVNRYQEAARSSLTIGEAFQPGAAAGAFDLVSGLKVAGYQKVLPQVLTHLRQAPDLVAQQSGYDIALVRNYVESLVMAPEVTLAFAPQLKDDALANRLFEKTGDVLYQKARAEGDLLGSQVTTALDMLQKIRTSVGI
jgi:hypothetical protein